MPGHGHHRVYIETTGGGGGGGGIPLRPRSPHPGLHYRRHSIDERDRPPPFMVREVRDEYDIMQNSGESLRTVNANLARQNNILSAQVQMKSQELQEQKEWSARLDIENQELRRSLESSSDVEGRRENKIRDLKRKNKQLEGDNEGLKARIRELLRIARDATDDRVRLLKDELLSRDKEIIEWRRRYDDVDRRLVRLRENMDDHIEVNQRLAADNELLRRRLEPEERLSRRHPY